MLALLLAGVTAARAQPGAGARAWDVGVPAADRRAAEALFGHAVELHEQLLRAQAVARYEQALALWENPYIRWNLALLMNDMGQHLRAYEHLERALAWGPEALGRDDWAKLAGMRRMLLAERLAVIEARCDQPGAALALDGKPWFRGPGAARRVVLPGEHVLTASKPGHFPLARTIILPAGSRGAVTVWLSIDGIVVQRRWARWQPWVVVGGGAAVALVGAGLERAARSDLAEARRTLARRCAGAVTCDPATPRAHGRGVFQRRVAAGALAMAGAITAAGLVLAYLNQPRVYRTEDRGGSAFDLVPMAAPDAAGVAARFRF